MVQLKVVESGEFGEYVLQDLQNCTHKLAMQFYDMPQAQEGDVLFLPKEWLDKKSPNFVHSLYFQPLPADEASDYSQENWNSGAKAPDVARLRTNERNYLLKRIYG